MTKTEHLLVCLNEKCVEVAKNIDKALRFGLGDTDPFVGAPLTNAKQISLELIDLLAVAEMLVELKHIPEYDNEEGKTQKKRKVDRYIRYADNIEILEREESCQQPDKRKKKRE